MTVFCELILTHSRYIIVPSLMCKMYNTSSEVGGAVLGVTALPASTPTTQSVHSKALSLALAPSLCS